VFGLFDVAFGTSPILRISDSEIRKTVYLEKLHNNSIVMADRGFKIIASLLAEKGCSMVRPPSVSSDEKLTTGGLQISSTNPSLSK